jgi:hypothetical protein
LLAAPMLRLQRNLLSPLRIGASDGISTRKGVVCTFLTGVGSHGLVALLPNWSVGSDFQGKCGNGGGDAGRPLSGVELELSSVVSDASDIKAWNDHTGRPRHESEAGFAAATIPGIPGVFLASPPLAAARVASLENDPADASNFNRFAGGSLSCASPALDVRSITARGAECADRTGVDCFSDRKSGRFKAWEASTRPGPLSTVRRGLPQAWTPAEG